MKNNQKLLLIQKFAHILYSLCNTEKAAGGGCVERSPSLVVAAVHVGAVLDQELHHVQVVVDARLQNNIRGEKFRWAVADIQESSIPST